MAKSGRGKAKIAGSKGIAVTDTAPISSEIQVGLEQLLAAPPESDLLRQFQALVAQAGNTPAGELALIDALGASRNEAAGRILTTIATAAPDKDHRKAARRALHKLKSTGLAVVAPIAEHQRTSAVVREPLTAVKALVSPSDGVGSQILWLALERPNSHGSTTIWHLAVNDIVGLKDMFTEEMSLRRFAARIAEWEDQSGMDAIEIPVEYGLALLSEALALNEESGFRLPREFVVRRQLLGELPPPPTDALIHQHIPRRQVLLTPDLLDASAILAVTEPEMEGWAFGYSETAPFARQYAEALSSSFIIGFKSKEQRQEEALDAAIDALFTPPIRRGFRRRLEETAYRFWKTDREMEARQAVAAAFAITDTGSLHAHPLLREVVLKSFEMVNLADSLGVGPPPDADRSAYTPI